MKITTHKARYGDIIATLFNLLKEFSFKLMSVLKQLSIGLCLAIFRVKRYFVLKRMGKFTEIINSSNWSCATVFF